ncbi:hypothetical protein GOV11_03520 [Candidatus Woesearchaeota archaeon]|nr:hypothetical protein [Candidatus Woesearchaeota archaeon]
MSDFEDFMNDRGEMRRMTSHIIKTEMLRNPGLERKVVEENRERNMLYVALTGAILLLVSLL